MFYHLGFGGPRSEGERWQGTGRGGQSGCGRLAALWAGGDGEGGWRAKRGKRATDRAGTTAGGPETSTNIGGVRGASPKEGRQWGGLGVRVGRKGKCVFRWWGRCAAASVGVGVGVGNWRIFFEFILPQKNTVFCPQPYKQEFLSEKKCLKKAKSGWKRT